MEYYFLQGNNLEQMYVRKNFFTPYNVHPKMHKYNEHPIYILNMDQSYFANIILQIIGAPPFSEVPLLEFAKWSFDSIMYDMRVFLSKYGNETYSVKLFDLLSEEQQYLLYTCIMNYVNEHIPLHSYIPTYNIPELLTELTTIYCKHRGKVLINEMYQRYRYTTLPKILDTILSHWEDLHVYDSETNEEFTRDIHELSLPECNELFNYICDYLSDKEGD